MEETINYLSEFTAEFLFGVGVLIIRKIEKRRMEKRLRKEIEEKLKQETETKS